MSVHDAVVAGGGPAGAVAALVLARRGHRVVLVHRPGPADGSAMPLGEALPAVTGRLLRDLGLGGVLGPPHVPGVGTLSAWGSSEPHPADALLDPDGVGWRLDRAAFDRSLRGAAAAAGAVVVEGCLRRPVRHGAEVTVELVDLDGRPASSRLICRWLLEASGRRAGLARALGAVPAVADRLVATMGCTDVHPSEDARTVVEAVPDGWWVTAPVPGRRRAVAYLTDADLAPPALLTPDGFRAALARTELVRRHADRPLTGPPQRRSAATRVLCPPYGTGWVAVGDAALAVDPLAAQGLLTALHTGLEAGGAVAAHLAGDRGALEGYADLLHAITAAYATNRELAYAAEGRWPERPFWRRRRPAPVPGNAPAVSVCRV